MDTEENGAFKIASFLPSITLEHNDQVLSDFCGELSHFDITAAVLTAL